MAAPKVNSLTLKGDSWATTINRLARTEVLVCHYTLATDILALASQDDISL